MAILGYNTKDTADPSACGGGRMYASQFTLASAATMSELHGWFRGGASSITVRIVIYADDGAGSPGARKAYTSLLTLPVTVDTELSESGFSVALAAGDYWIGFKSTSSGSGAALYAALTGGPHKGRSASVADPPPDPFGTTDVSGTRKHSAWAVVDVAAAAFVPKVILT